MSAPVISSISFDKPGYPQGSLITATVKYLGSSFMLSAKAAASDGTTGILTGSFTVLPIWTVTDTGSRTWALKSDDGSTAVFTATA